MLRETFVPSPNAADQKVAIISGLGGIGKTQLAIAFAKATKTDFSAVFWINAKSEILLRQGVLALVPRLSLVPSPQGLNMGSGDEDQGIIQFRNWLSRSENTRWLLIFDNYDDPEAYSIKQFFPYRVQGSIIITTRSSQLSFGKAVPVKELKQEQGLEILARRSNRPQAIEGKYRFIKL